MSARLKDKKVLLTQSQDYMGPAINKLFSAEGAQVIARAGRVPWDEKFHDYCKGLDDTDIVIANLAHDPCNMPVADIKNEDWHGMFNIMVHPLMQLIRHFAPIMANRGGGKIVAITSAAPLRGIPGSTAYCSARGAQNAFIKATGLEFASSNVQIRAPIPAPRGSANTKQAIVSLSESSPSGHSTALTRPKVGTMTVLCPRRCKALLIASGTACVKA